MLNLEPTILERENEYQEDKVFKGSNKHENSKKTSVSPSMAITKSKSNNGTITL